MRRTKEEAAITRQHILKEALSVFSQKGYAAATLEDIAQAAEVTRGAIYWHFDGKAELYNTLIREYSEQGSAIVQQAASEGGSLLDILRRVFIRQLQAIEADPALRALIELQLFKTGLDPELAEGRQQRIDASLGLVEMLTGIMGQGVDSGLIRSDLDPKEMARAYLALQNGLIHLWLTAPGQFSLNESAGSFADILIAGLQVQRS